MHSLTNLPPLDGVSAMLAAAEAGSFSAAAERLGLTHGSVSRRIAALERWLGTRLFDRHGRGVRLTPAGQRFRREAESALGMLQRSAEQWRPWTGRQTVRLSAVPSFARLWLLPRLPEIERGDIHIDLIMDHRTSDLDAREADLAIRYGKGDWEGLQAQRLFGETLVPAAAPMIADRLDGERRVEGLLSVPLLHDSDSSQWSAWLARAGIRYRPRWQDRRFEDYDSVIAAAAAGLGIALLRLPLARHLLVAGTLRPVHDHAMPNPTSHFICMRESENRLAPSAVAERLLGLAAGLT